MIPVCKLITVLSGNAINDILRQLNLFKHRKRLWARGFSNSRHSLAQLFGHDIVFSHREEKKLWEDCQTCGINSMFFLASGPLYMLVPPLPTSHPSIKLTETHI